MSRQPRFEVVRSDAGWFLRFRASNGRRILQSEIYARESGARNAMRVLADCCQCAYSKAPVIEVDERGSDEDALPLHV